MAALNAVPDDEPRVIVATGRYVGEGFDDARLDTLFLAMPASWKGTLQHYVGRLHRTHHGKTEVCVYDYIDQRIPMLMRMLDRRLGRHWRRRSRRDAKQICPEASSGPLHKPTLLHWQSSR